MLLALYQSNDWSSIQAWLDAQSQHVWAAMRKKLEAHNGAGRCGGALATCMCNAVLSLCQPNRRLKSVLPCMMMLHTCHLGGLYSLSLWLCFVLCITAAVVISRYLPSALPCACLQNDDASEASQACNQLPLCKFAWQLELMAYAASLEPVMALHTLFMVW